MYCIAIDDGHGRETAGKRTPIFADGSVMLENMYNDAVGKLLGELLEKHGFQVIFVAPEETDTPLQIRVKRANAGKADIYISIHANAYGNGWNPANGVESWIYSEANEETIRLAEYIQAAFVQETGRKDRGVKKSSNLYVLNSTRMPAVLVEGGFMTNSEEAALLRSDEYRQKSAVGICKGICKFYGVTYIENEEEQEVNSDMKRYQRIEELPYGQEVIERLVKEGVIKGEEKERLNLSEDMLRILMILDRKNIL